MSLRVYQIAAVKEIRELFKTGTDKVLLHAATGSGKTVVFSHILGTVAARGFHALMVVRGRKLVDQASKRLHRESIDHGVVMAGHWNYNPNALIQVCSIDTLNSRNLAPKAKLIVIDEAHFAVSPSYMQFLSKYSDVFILGVTATPYTEKSLRHIADAIVKPISITELIEQGFLVPARHFAPSTPDLSEVRISYATHDYVQDELSEAMEKGALTGDIVEHWKKLGENRPTLCFAVSIRHSKNIVEQFKNAGIRAEHCDADTKESEREEIIKRLEAGTTQVVSNVGIFCTGVDIPLIGCIILARPTKSYNLYIQQCGRGTRPAENKTDFIILDHAGNITEHGLITEEPEANLDGKPVTKQKKPKTCSQCFAVYYDVKCPMCGYQKPGSVEDKREIIVTEGHLKEVQPDSPRDREVKQEIAKLKFLQQTKGYKKGWVYHKIKDRYGEETANTFFPKRNGPSWLNRGTHGTSERHPSGSVDEAELQGVEIPKVAMMINGKWMQYGVKGMADISGVLRHNNGLGLRLEIEIKTGSARQSDDQRNFERMIKSLGGLYFVARSIEDALAFVDKAATI